MSAPAPPTCKTCPFWEVNVLDGKPGECHIRSNPPLLGLSGGLISWTPRYEYDWCGEHPENPLSPYRAQMLVTKPLSPRIPAGLYPPAPEICGQELRSLTHPTAVETCVLRKGHVGDHATAGHLQAESERV